MSGEEGERLQPWTRFAFAIFGAALLLAALPVGVYCLFFAAAYVAPGHGVVPDPVDWAAGLSLFAFPLLMLALAGFSLACTDWRRLAIVGGLAAALLAEGALALYLLDLSQRSEPPSTGITRYPDVESAKEAHGLPPDSAPAQAPAPNPPPTRRDKR